MQQGDLSVRGISNTFIDDLNQGLLKEILNRIKEDDTLSLEIRDSFINVYYRGGNAIKITEKGPCYEFWFDAKYSADPLIRTRISNLPKTIITSQSVSEWINELPMIKNQMDLWFSKHRKEERDYQQVVVRENNYGGSANDTDYYICDIEYANEKGRFDMIAVKWPSTSSQRKQNNDLGLAFIEMKYMDKSLTGSAGLVGHIIGMNAFLSIPSNLENVKEEMMKIFNQKVQMGLLGKIKEIASFNNAKPEYILVLGNHDPAKSVLRRELDSIIHSNIYCEFCSKVEFKIATSSLMGYGLYNECVYQIDDFLNKYSHIVK